MKNRPNTLSRRTFIRAAGAAAAGAVLPGALRHALAQPASPARPVPGGLPESEWDFIQPAEAAQEMWGRVTWAGYPIRAETGLNKPVVDYLHEGTVLPLLEVIDDEGGNPNNRTWYRIKEGYLYTSGVQVIEPYRMPQIRTSISTEIDGEPGFWAQTIVPVTTVHHGPSGAAVYDQENEMQVFHYYGSVHRVIDVDQDGAGNVWYKVFDDKPKAKPVWVLARYMRPLTDRDFAPINPGAKDKKLVMVLDTQTIKCYEGDELVFSTLTSSGGGGFGTPPGEWAVIYKQPSRHMYSGDGDPASGGDAEDDFFDLPGVPFNVFFTTLGHASHGTWWHGDYGRPRSHGCLNVTPQDAQWIYRWVEPVAGYGVSAAGSSREPGTPVIVVQSEG